MCIFCTLYFSEFLWILCIFFFYSVHLSPCLHFFLSKLGFLPYISFLGTLFVYWKWLVIQEVAFPIVVHEGLQTVGCIGFCISFCFVFLETRLLYNLG